jgi:flagellar FliL protein
MATAAAKAPIEAPAAPKKKSSLLLIIGLVVLLIVASGAGTWWFLTHSEADEDEDVRSEPAIFLPLEQFTVNLQPEDGQQFLQTAMTLRVSDQDVADAIKTQMPEVRSRILLLLSSKKPSEVTSTEGKNRLIEEILREVEASLPPLKHAKKAKKRSRDDENVKGARKSTKAKAKAKDEAEAEEEPAPSRVLAVYFTHFIVQ